MLALDYSGSATGMFYRMKASVGKARDEVSTMSHQGQKQAAIVARMTVNTYRKSFGVSSTRKVLCGPVNLRLSAKNYPFGCLTDAVLAKGLAVSIKPIITIGWIEA